MDQTQLKAMIASWARAFVTALLAAVPAAWEGMPSHDLSTWTWATVFAFTASVLLTAINALRSGDTRFGVGAKKDTAEDVEPEPFFPEDA